MTLSQYQKLLRLLKKMWAYQNNEREEDWHHYIDLSMLWYDIRASSRIDTEWNPVHKIVIL